MAEAEDVTPAAPAEPSAPASAAPATEISYPDTDPAPEPDAPQLSETEHVAKLIGWAPKDQWRGDPAQWRSAPEYILHGDHIRREMSASQRQLREDFERRVESLSRVGQQALINQRNAIYAEAEERKRAAASVGDMETYYAADQNRDYQLQQFDRSLPEEAFSSTRGAASPPAPPPEVADFLTRNHDWFNRDTVMTAAAVQQNGIFAQQFPNLPPDQVMRMTEAEIKKRFNYGGPAPSDGGPPKVEGGLRAIQTKAQKDWASLPPEAKKDGARFIKQGLFKDGAAYAASYWAQD